MDLIPPCYRSVKFTLLAIALPLAVLFGSGCAARQNVGPLYDTAIRNFEEAQQLETKAVNTSAEFQLEEFRTMAKELEVAARTLLNTLIITTWKGEDFAEKRRGEAWRAVLGLPLGSNLLDEQLNEQRFRFRGHLALRFEYLNPNGKKQSRLAFEFYKNPAMIDNLKGKLKVADAEKQGLTNDLQAWREYLDNVLVGKSPVVEKVQAATNEMITSIENERERRVQRLDATYNALVDMTRSARTYAGGLTSSVALVSLANSVLGFANKQLSIAEIKFGHSVNSTP